MIYKDQNIRTQLRHLRIGTKMFVRGGGTYVRAPKYTYVVVALTYGHQIIRTRSCLRMG